MPKLGRITAVLYTHPEQTYNLLNNEHHIQRMKRIDQLGVIRNVYEGAHHPRWEYVILQLNLINRLQELGETRGLGLSSTTDFLDFSISGAEILQIWVLLLNSGHLPGTFATERAFLRICKNQKSFKNAIYNGLPSEKKSYFNQIVTEEEVYSFHKILIAFHLNRYKRFRKYDTGDSKFVDFLQEILNFYLFEHEDLESNARRNNLKYIFFRIRQISYLFLDSQYFPYPISFELSMIFLNLPEYVEDLFKEPDSQIIKTLNSFDDLLSINMYHSMGSISELGHHSNEIEKIISNDAEDWKLHTVTGLQNYLIDNYHVLDPSKIQDIQPGEYFHILFDLDLDNNLKDQFKKKLSFKNEEKWSKQFGNKCEITFQSSPTRKHNAITMLLYNSNTPERKIKIVGKFLKNFISLNNEIKSNMLTKRHNIVDTVFQKPSKDLILDILKHITIPDLYFEFKDTNEIFILPTKGTGIARSGIKHYLANIDCSDDRIHELNTLSQALKEITHRTELLVSLSRILVYDKERQVLTDLDGFAMGFSKGKLKILLVEAKNQRSGSRSASKRHLWKTLSKLRFKTSEEIELGYLSRCRNYYCYFTVDGLVP